MLTTAEAPERHRQPEILPGGKAVLFTIWSGIGTAQKRIALLNLETGEQTPLIPRGSQPRYAGTGHIVYANQGIRARGSVRRRHGSALPVTQSRCWKAWRIKPVAP